MSQAKMEKWKKENCRQNMLMQLIPTVYKSIDPILLSMSFWYILRWGEDPHWRG